ncbi:MAG: HNH endonuclease [Flavobacteriaceae bacterium]|nr:HNH endonuclease [Flavobacteriaceae bacterium]
MTSPALFTANNPSTSIVQALEIYTKYFYKLKRATNKGLPKAPHKPLLLLSIIQLIKAKKITSSRIFISPELVLVFKANWNLFVNSKHVPNFSLPFFHLRSEPFWNLTAKIASRTNIHTIKSISSLKKLADTVAFAEIDTALFHLLNNDETNAMMENLLLSHYFDTNKLSNPTLKTNQLALELENEILNEDGATYAKKITKLQETLNKDNFEEEIFVRGGIFKKTIPKIYKYRCCISGMAITSTSNAQMVDACHIKPFSLCQDDTIPNGISLSPNLHRAFDRGLLTINKDYVVRISPTVTDNNSVYSISQFEGKQILLPENYKHYPSTAAFLWHAKEVFKL